MLYYDWLFIIVEENIKIKGSGYMHEPCSVSTLVLLKPNTQSFENNVDPDHLVLNQHCFPSSLLSHCNKRNRPIRMAERLKKDVTF